MECHTTDLPGPAAGRGRGDPAVEAMLARHVDNGDIKHVVEDVYGTLPKGCTKFGKYPIDPYLVAGWLRPGAILAYYSALDLHGYGYSITSCVAKAFAHGEPCEMRAHGFIYEFMEPAPGIVLDDPSADGIETLNFMDADIRLTTLERTLADIFARPDRCGLLVESLDFSYDLDFPALLRQVHSLGDAAAAGAMGFWLESDRERCGVDDATLRELRALAPRETRYALRARPGPRSLPAPGWNVILPREIVRPTWQGMEM